MDAFCLSRAAFLGNDAASGGLGPSVIVCSCNILSDHDIREIAVDPDYVPPRVAEVYRRLGCSAECGRCARTISSIIQDSISKLAGDKEPEAAE
jgi:bacterioferritin-associated ferredoxin